MGLLDYAMAQADQYGVPPALVASVMMAESGGKPGLVSPKGALGPMQLMPATAKGLGVDPNDPYQNIDGGVRYLKQQLDAFGNDQALAAAAYNAGPGNVRKYGGIPPFAETQQYVQKVMGNADGSSIFGGVRPQEKPKSGADIFGMSDQTPTAKPTGGGGSGADIFSSGMESIAIPDSLFKQEQPAAADGQAGNQPGVMDAVKRGVRDVTGGTIQAFAHGLNAIAPAGSAFEGWTKDAADKTDQLVSESRQAYEQARGQGKGFDWGRLGGNVAAGLPLVAASGLNPATWTGGLASGALLGAANSVDTTQKDYADAKKLDIGAGAIGGVLGTAGGKVVGRLLRPVDNVLPEASQAGSEAAGRLGVELTPGQTTGNTTLKALEEVLAKTPGSANRAAARKGANQEAINRAAAMSVGQDSPALTESVLSNARQQLGDSFKALSDKTSVAFGDDFLNSLIKVEGSNGELRSFANPEIASVIDKGLELAAQGDLSGKAYQAIRSKISNRASDAFRGNNSEVGQALTSFRDALDNSARSGMDDATKAAWDQTRQMWANLRTLEKGAVVEGGNVMAGRMPGALRTANAAAYKEGSFNTPLMDIARYAEAFKPTVGDSGTATRQWYQGLLSGNPLSVVGAPVANLMDRAIFSRPGRYMIQEGLLPSGIPREALPYAGGLLGPEILNQYRK